MIPSDDIKQILEDHPCYIFNMENLSDELRGLPEDDIRAQNSICETNRIVTSHVSKETISPREFRWLQYMCFGNPNLPTRDKIKKYLYEAYINDTAECVGVICDLPNRDIIIDCIVDRLKIDKLDFIEANIEEKLELFLSKNIPLFCASVADFSNAISATDKIHKSMCAKIPNLKFTECIREIIPNKFTEFYYFGQPAKQFSITLKFTYFSSIDSTSSKQNDKINQEWNYISSKSRNNTPPEVHATKISDNICNHIKQTFTELNLIKTLNQCIFHDLCNTTTENLTDEEKTFLYHICKKTWLNYSIEIPDNKAKHVSRWDYVCEVPYTNVIYDIQINFEKNKPPINIPKSYVGKLNTNKFQDILMMIPHNEAQYDENLLDESYCPGCKHLENCDPYSQCADDFTHDTVCKKKTHCTCEAHFMAKNAKEILIQRNQDNKKNKHKTKQPNVRSPYEYSYDEYDECYREQEPIRNPEEEAGMWFEPEEYLEDSFEDYFEERENYRSRYDRDNNFDPYEYYDHDSDE